MPFQKGQSGNKKGRPKQTDEQKDERTRFQALLREATHPAMESIIAIACDERSRDRFKACQFIIDKAFGANTAFLTDDGSSEPITIHIVRSSAGERDQDDDDDWG